MEPQNQRLDREYDDEGDVSPAETNDFDEITATHTCEAMRGAEMSTATTTRETVGELSTTDREQFRESIRRADAASDHF